VRRKAVGLIDDFMIFVMCTHTLANEYIPIGREKGKLGMTKSHEDGI
jgi:hypothetical protein